MSDPSPRGIGYRITSLLFTAILFGAPNDLTAATINIAANADTTLISAAPTRNFGASTQLWVQKNAQTALLRFDLSALGSITASQATLNLNVTGYGGSGDVYLMAYALAPANYNWVEGTGGAYPGSVVTGASGWSSQQHDTMGWAEGTAGALGGSPVLLTSRLIASTAPTGNIQLSITNGAVLQAWIDHGAIEIVLAGVGNNLQLLIASRETATPPTLDLVYQSVPEPKSILLSASFLLLAFAAKRRKAIPLA